MGNYTSNSIGDVMYRLLAGSIISMFVWVCTSALGQAAQIVNLGASFTPDRLGASTTVTAKVKIATTTGAVPPPLIDIDVHLPAGIGLAATTLGTATCSASVLLSDGPIGCPPNSVMGYGRAEVAIPLGGLSALKETASVVILMGKSVDNQTTMLFYAQGWSPVAAEFVFADQLVGDAAPFGEQLNTIIPEIPSVPGGPGVAVVRIESSIGPRSLVYYRRTRGKRVPYRPVGMQVPQVCPPHGFPFRVDLTFGDGSHASARTVVPCPAYRGRSTVGHARRGFRSSRLPSRDFHTRRPRRTTR